jgi:moderate conductance mechanosensitive channel
VNNIFEWQINWASVLQVLLKIAVILIVAWLAYAILKVIIKKAIFREKNIPESQLHRLKTLRSLVTNIALYVIIFITSIAVLGEFGVDATGILASAGVLGLAIGFGAKDLVSDVVTGFFSLMEEHVNVGEYVTVKDYTGVVEEFGLRSLRIRSANGDLHFISNREILSLTNHSRGNMRALVDISLSTKANVDEAIKYLQGACEQWKARYEDLVDGPEVIGVQAIGSGDYTVRIIAKTKNGKQDDVENALRQEILKLNIL